MKKTDLRGRLDQRLDKSAPSGCHLWTGKKTSKGYGVMMVRGRMVGVHRVAWHVATGDPLDMPEVVRHVICRTPACANAAHLAKGTTADNNADMRTDGTWTHGDGVRTAVMNEEQVQAFRDLYAQGWGPSALSRVFGISQSAASSIARGETWAWL